VKPSWWSTCKLRFWNYNNNFSFLNRKGNFRQQLYFQSYNVQFITNNWNLDIKSVIYILVTTRGVYYGNTIFEVGSNTPDTQLGDDVSKTSNQNVSHLSTNDATVYTLYRSKYCHIYTYWVSTKSLNRSKFRNCLVFQKILPLPKVKFHLFRNIHHHIVHLHHLTIFQRNLSWL